MSSTVDTRTYHNTSSSYFLPNDSEEHQRLDAQSNGIIKMMGGRPYQTAIQDIAREVPAFKAADIGCGTGVMTRYIGKVTLASQVDRTIQSRVYGVDLSPVEPITGTPENVEFVQGDIMNLPKTDARFQPDTFDFLTSRMLVLGISDWEAYTRKLFSLLKPGGRIELQDLPLQWYDIDNNDISQHWKFYRVLKQASQKTGIDITAPHMMKQAMINAGFVDVKELNFVWNYTDKHWEAHPDSDEIGHYSEHILTPFLRVTVEKVVRNAAFDTPDELEGLEDVEQVKQDCARTMKDLPKGTHSKYYVVTGRKP